MLCIALVIYVCLHGSNRIHIMKNATPQEQKDWFEEDFFMKGDLKALMGLGKPSGPIDVTASNILIFAFLLASLFLGTISVLLLGTYFLSGQ